MTRFLNNDLLKKYLRDKKTYFIKEKYDWVINLKDKRLTFHNFLNNGEASIKDFKFTDVDFQKPKEIYVNNLLFEANLSFELGEYEGAMRHFQIVLEKDPKNKDALFKLGLIYFLMCHYKGALDCFDKIISLDTESEVNYVYVLKGLVLDECEKKEEAIKYYEKAFLKEALDAELIFTLDTVIFSFLNKEEKILGILDFLIKKYTDNRSLIHKKALILYNLDRLDKALECLNIITENDDVYKPSLFTKGHIFDDLEQLNDALICFEKIIELEPDNFRAWFFKGNILNKKEEKELALECYNKAIEINKEFVDALNNKGLVLEDLERFEEALEIFNKAIEIEPNYYLPYFNKACVLKELDRFDEALEFFDKVNELNPIEIDGYYNKATLLKQLGRYDEAIESYRRVLDLDDEDIEALLGMGISYISLETPDYSKAIDCMNKALEIDPKHKEAMDLLSKIKQLEESTGLEK